MNVTHRHPARRKRAFKARLVFICLAAVLCARAQHPHRLKTNDEKARELLDNKEHTFEDLLRGEPKAVANAKEIFRLSSDAMVKRRTAGVLITVGVTDRIYFEYLVSEAKKALDNPMPWPTAYDDHGRINQNVTPAFIAWCKKQGIDDANDPKLAAYRASDPVFLEWTMKRHLNLNNTRYAAYYEIPIPWYDLAAARDPRAYDLLVQGLHSHNLMIASVAAKGLAKLQDPRAIDVLITVGRRVPGEARAGIMEALLYFDDPKAQAAAEELADVLDNKHLFELIRANAKKYGVKGLFPY
jgi:PBS lyase HEAT-like repeat-containing protein